MLSLARVKGAIWLPTIYTVRGRLLEPTITMPRIPYIFPTPGESQIADKIRERRKDGKLIELDGIL